MYRQIRLNGTPQIHSTSSGPSTTIQCADSCTGVSGIPCTGFQLTSDHRCSLFTGIVQENATGPTDGNEDLVYVVYRYPPCLDYIDFQIFEHEDLYGRKYVYCLHLPNTTADYKSARRYCLSKGSQLMFVNEREKAVASSKAFSSLINVRHFWNGVKRVENPNGVHFFHGEYPYQVLDKDSDLGRQYPAIFSSIESIKGCIAFWARRPENINCSERMHYACEVSSFTP